MNEGWLLNIVAHILRKGLSTYRLNKEFTDEEVVADSGCAGGLGSLG